MTTWARARPHVEEIDWSGYWGAELARVAAENPRFSVVLVSSKTGLSFGGIVPTDWNGQTLKLFV